MKTLILDNYDSFTYNFAQYVAELGGNPIVRKNDKITVREITKMRPTHIIISPGPGTPVKKKDFGICGEVILAYRSRKKDFEKIPLLGICLGHQGIIHAFGGKVIRAPEIMHGQPSEARLLSTSKKIPGLRYPNIFHDLPKKIQVMRYHSLIGNRETMPRELLITAETTHNELVMAFQHREFPLYGIQFHPESIGTPRGKDILENFLKVNCHGF